MVSFWPWKGDDSSPASFEKALSTLSEKITKANIRLDAQRSRARRYKALWTLYTSFAYLLYFIVLALVLGWQKWGITEYVAVLGGPPVIYLVRLGISMFFDWRTSGNQAHVDDLQRQRDIKIEKLKAATKYNSTQQLLEKYGGSSIRKGPSKDAPKGQKPSPNQKSATPPGGRTGIAPPPTANIQRSATSGQPSTPINNPRRALTSPLQQPTSSSQTPTHVESPTTIDSPTSPDEPGFAPNAYPSAPQYVEQHRWYDRLMDVLLGEDEALPKNRLALICKHCRLVNGQAPPGVKGVEDIGKWRCGGCGGWNGEENEARKLMKEMKKNEEKDRAEGWSHVSRGNEREAEGSEEEAGSLARKEESTHISSDDDKDTEDEDSDETPARNLRSRKSKGGVTKEEQ